MYEYLRQILRWLPDVQNDFAARADWCVKSYADANHAPVITPSVPKTVKAAPGQKVKLSLRASDPDGDALSYQWWFYPEAGSYQGEPVLSGTDGPSAEITVPADAKTAQTLHCVCTVRDNGSPQLTRYHRVVIEVK